MTVSTLIEILEGIENKNLPVKFQAPCAGEQLAVGIGAAYETGEKEPSFVLFDLHPVAGF